MLLLYGIGSEQASTVSEEGALEGSGRVRKRRSFALWRGCACAVTTVLHCTKQLKSS